MDTPLTSRDATQLGRILAPEDIQRGDYISVFMDIDEFHLFWCLGHTLPDPVTIRLRTRPCGEPRPLKVKAICLPYVFVKKPSGKVMTLDVRQVELIRLDRAYGRTVYRALREQRRRRRNASKK